MSKPNGSRLHQARFPGLLATAELLHGRSAIVAASLAATCLFLLLLGFTSALKPLEEMGFLTPFALLAHAILYDYEGDRKKLGEALVHLQVSMCLFLIIWATLRVVAELGFRVGEHGVSEDGRP